jgi:hypothetical protein
MIVTNPAREALAGDYWASVFALLVEVAIGAIEGETGSQ